MDIDKIKGFKAGFKGLIGSNKPEDGESVPEEEFYNTSKEEYHVENGMAGSKMMLLEPRAYSESQQIADYLKNRNAVIVNLKRVTPDVAKRIVDFLYGTIYAIGGGLEKLGGGIFLCTPNNVKIDGTISDDNQAKAAGRPAKKEEKNEEEDFF